MFSVMWSEHCSYKSSRPLLRTLPTGAAEDGSSRGRARTPASSRSATGSRSRSRSRSHNHPSAVEPYQGAATGVGGILRDIFTMGARPIAVLDALRFGDPSSARTRHLVDGVVRGVGGYGNCVGVPTVGGELVFDPTLRGQPARQRDGDRAARGAALTRAAAPGPGQSRRAVRLDDGPRRDRRGERPRHRRRSTDDEPSKRPERPGRRPVRREAADRGVARADRARARRRPPGPRRRRDHLRDLRDGRPGRDRDADRPRRDPAARAGHGPVRGDDLASRRSGCSRSSSRTAGPTSRAVCERWGLPVAVIGRVTDDGDIVDRRRRRRRSSPGSRPPP